MSLELLKAIEVHDVEKVKLLLKRGASPNAPHELPTCSSRPIRPLELALGEMEFGGSIEIIKTLIKAGAKVNQWDVDKSHKPLHVAYDIESIHLLLESGADPNCISESGEIPLKDAVEEGEFEIAKLLLQYGATKTINECRGMYGRTALSLAVEMLNVKMTKLLLDNGADSSNVDEDSMPASHYLQNKSESNMKEVNEIQKLLAR